MTTRLKPRLLSNGKIYCVEFAKTNGDHDDCALELEDSFYQSEQDKKGGIIIVEKAIKQLRLQRKPCNIFKRTFNPSEC